VAQPVGMPVPLAAGVGRNTALLRRRGGIWSAAFRNAAGAISIGAEGAAGAMPANLSQVDVGANFSNGAQVGAPIEFIGVRRGSFSDADVSALLAAA
jgi:hypothetical protein